jgi:hypothetical protein
MGRLGVGQAVGAGGLAGCTVFAVPMPLGWFGLGRRGERLVSLRMGWGRALPVGFFGFVGGWRLGGLIGLDEQAATDNRPA